ncbi:MAG: GDP-mannose 4,6-dehydratase, partial [Fidelibacterota bacterium]
IYGDGEQSRDFTFVDNVVQANILACHAPNAPGEVINVACGKRITVNHLFQIIRGILKKDYIESIHEPARPGDIRHSLADISKAEKILSYKPVVNLEEGIERAVEWFKKIL